MRRRLRQLLPSMFHRRLLLLSAVAAGLGGLLIAQTARLTLGAEHDHRRRIAELALQDTELVPTVRGRILDRHGRVLAEDEPGWAVAVDYRVINGSDWAWRRAYEVAKREAGPKWSDLTAAERSARAARHAPRYFERAQQMWHDLADITGTPREDIEHRLSDIVADVQRQRSHLQAIRKRRLERERGEPVSWDEAEEPIREERIKHVVLGGIDDRQRAIIERFLAEARMQQEVYERAVLEDSSAEDHRTATVWLEVDLFPISPRRYPWETKTIVVDRSYFPALIASEEPMRVPVAGVGRHVLGLMRPARDVDMDRRPYRRPGAAPDPGGYRDGDEAGAWGIERAYEAHLRGARGRVVVHLDTGQRDVTPPQPGKDVRLTIDIQLQARVQALMDPEVGLMRVQEWHLPPPDREDLRDPRDDRQLGDPLNGAAVVLDIKTGEVLAAVSTPAMPLADWQENPDLLKEDYLNRPTVNKAVEMWYQPGSTMKPLILTAAVSAGLLQPGELVHCKGFLWDHNPLRYRDWLYKRGGPAFGDIDGVFAIARSSNVFFGKMAQRLGMERMIAWLDRYGIGRPTGSELPEEQSGTLADPDDPTARHGWEYMAIGQGRVDWTPLQAANAYATLARGGELMRPTFVLSPGLEPDPDNAGGLRPTRRPRTPIGVTREAARMAMQGMWESANEPHGTTHHLSAGERTFNAEGVRVMAKSGTAQAVDLRPPIDDDGDGLPDRWGQVIRRGDHAWVIALVGPDDPTGRAGPTHVVVVLVEFGGSGGRVAGPVVNAVIHAMQAEGYLPGE